MSAGTGIESDKGAAYGGSVPWVDVLLSAIAAVSWALIGMAGTAALGLHLLGADTVGSLGPMTAAVVALGAGGSVSPSGDVSAFGLTGAEANTAIEITPLGVGLVGALLLSWFFLRSLRTAGVVVAPAELLARAGAVVALFVAMLGGLAWAGHDVITLDGGALGLDDLPGVGGGGGGGGGLEIPGLGDVGGLLPDRVGDLIDAKAAVGFTVDTAPTLLGGLVWSAGILLIALLASRRTPLPRGWEAVHRTVRPAVSALVTVVLLAVAAGLAAAAYAAIGDAHPKRIAGAALLGAPNGVWLGLSVGLFVPWDGEATGVLTQVLPDPLDDLLGSGSGQSVTLGRLAELDGRVWLLGVATAVMMLLAGVLAAARTPVGAGVGAGAGAGGRGVTGFVGRCALRLGIVTAVALPLLGWPAAVSVDASLSVLGFDAFGAGIELHQNAGMALLLGAVWGAGAGAAGALLASATGAAGRRAARLALGDVSAGAGSGVGAGVDTGVGVDAGAGQGRAEGAGPYAPNASYRPPNPATNPYLRVPDEVRGPQDARPGEGRGGGDGSGGRGRGGGTPQGRSYESARPGEPGARSGRGAAGASGRGSGGPSGASGRGSGGPSGAPGRGSGQGAGQGSGPGSGQTPGQAPGPGSGQAPGQGPRQAPRQGSGQGSGPGDVYGAPTVVGPVGPLPPRRPGGGGPDDGTPPPPPPPPPAPRGPKKPR
ncbi:streptophobe family protein [Streptomyces phaeofaciens]|uniref:streptophobe family protein n=1 Tax=Streptomyces phaeofaciens TaxID=68254 RepID=UPI0036B81860